MDTAPFESVHDLFQEFNQRHFDCKLDGTVVEWSNRMTLCAGICYLKREAHSAKPFCIIRLSARLLQFRPFEDTISTLLHEMIHAHLWMNPSAQSVDIVNDHSAHGPDFLAWAQRINRLEQHRNVNITVFHSFHDQVRHCQRHVWKCNGPCQWTPPYYGHVRRAMNRPPQSADWWFASHQKSCGGVFTKVSEPSSNASTAEVLTIKHADDSPLLPCPICSEPFDRLDTLNLHLDSCLNPIVIDLT